MLRWKLEIFPSSMASFSIIGPIICKRMTSFSPLSFSGTYNSCNISICSNVTRKVGAHDKCLSSFTYQSSYCDEKQMRGVSLIAFDGNNSESEGEDDHGLDAVMKLYSAFKRKHKHELTSDERQSLSNFISFFETFQGRTVLEFFSYLANIFGNNIQIIFKPTPKDGINIGLRWRFDWDKIQIPLWKGFNLHISHTYHGRAVIRNIETFMEPLSHLQPFGRKMKIGLGEFMEKIGLFMVSNSVKKAKRILYLLLAVSSLAAFLLFIKLAS